MLRWIFGLIMLLVFAQFPAFSQQYVQRLGGAAAELADIVEEFDKAASSSELTREEALASFDGSEFLLDHQGDMRATIRRSEILSADYASLSPKSDIERLSELHRFRDFGIARAALADFRPSIPLTRSALIICFFGFAIGYFLGALLDFVFGRRRKSRGLV